MGKPGRPTKYTPEVADEIVDGIALGLTDKDAAIAAGISEDTFARWLARYADFADRLTRARAQRTRGWLQGIRKLANEDRDLRAYESLLDRCSPEYRKVSKVESTVTFDARKAAEKVAAELDLPVDVVLAETYRMVEDGQG